MAEDSVEPRLREISVDANTRNKEIIGSTICQQVGGLSDQTGFRRPDIDHGVPVSSTLQGIEVTAADMTSATKFLDIGEEFRPRDAAIEKCDLMPPGKCPFDNRRSEVIGATENKDLLGRPLVPTDAQPDDVQAGCTGQ